MEGDESILTMRRTIVIALFVILTLCFVFNRFYMNVQNEHWDEKTKAVEIAYDQTILAKATKVDSFYGDEPYQIVYGEDKIGQKVVVWVSEHEVHTEMAGEAFTEDQVRSAVLKKDPDFEIMRIMPGKMADDYVWEVFYKKKDDSGTRYFYDYYKFSNGTYIDTYRLSLQ